MLLEFAEYLPDLPDFNNPGATVAKNVMPGGMSYRQILSPAAYSSALTAYARGAFAAREPQFGTSKNFAGDATKLYLLGATSGSVWDDISKAGGYSLSDEGWEFTQFGTRVIATNIAEPMQSYVINSSTLFADLSATAPKARHIDVVRNFVMVANTFDASDGFKPNRVRWCALGDATDWTISATTQADIQDLDAVYGWCTKVVGGDYATIFQERAITRLDYVGSPAIFQVTVVETGQGSRYSNSIIKVGGFIYYIGLDGFYAFDGAHSVPIGQDKVDRFFLNDLDTQFDYRICAAVDYVNEVIVWAYPGNGHNENGDPNRLLFYNYAPRATKRWSLAEFDTEFIYSALSEGYTLDTLDDWLSAHSISISIDLLPYSLDSRVWTGNDIKFGYFNTDHELAFGEGTALQAVIETAETEIHEGQKTELYLLKPIIQKLADSAPTITMQLGTRDLQSVDVGWSSPVSPDADGNCQFRSQARYHRVRVTIDGGFKYAVGVEVLDSKASGAR